MDSFAPYFHEEFCHCKLKLTHLSYSYSVKILILLQSKKPVKPH